jgi:signal transduction histidine kinase
MPFSDINPVFSQELKLIDRAEQLVGESDGTVSIKEYIELLDSYKALLTQSNKLMRVSDNAQRKLIKTQEKLEDSAKEIHSKNNELTELVATKDKFFSIISHDLRNPIASVLMMTDLLKSHSDKMQPEELKMKLEKINSAVDSLYSLFENLHRWSQSQSGKIDYNPSRQNLLILTKNIYTLLKVQADNKNIAIELDIDPEIFVKCDENMIETVLRNLISNAIKFTPDNGRIIVGGREEDGMMKVSVRDTGVGIPQENISKLFTIDSKVQTKGTNRESGSGLGLVVCKEFVETHNGKLWVDSTVGKGSTFFFTLPNEDS